MYWSQLTPHTSRKTLFTLISCYYSPFQCAGHYLSSIHLVKTIYPNILLLFTLSMYCTLLNPHTSRKTLFTRISCYYSPFQCAVHYLPLVRLVSMARGGCEDDKRPQNETTKHPARFICITTVHYKLKLCLVNFVILYHHYQK